MKKFLFKLVIAFAFFVLFDFAFGAGMNYIANHIEVGGRGRDNYICNKSKDDVLIFGSSRAVHHYNACILEDSLGLSCYNCGDDGTGVITAYGRLMMINKRHQPKIIILDIYPPFDIEQNDNHKYLGRLKPRYENDGISELFDEIDEKEKYKMMCKTYRYNSTYLQNIFSFFTSVSNDTGIKGFRPLKGEIDPMKIKETSDTKTILEADSTKLKFINDFIDLAGDAKLYFIVSPNWYGMDTIQFASIREISRKRCIPFVDYSNDDKYVHHDEYFKDGNHLNARGADEFTNDLIRLIKRDLSKEATNFKDCGS